jgi:acyl-CoA thioester hydrolase
MATVFRHRLRVRYAETDVMGLAHHAAYVPWFEEARIEALRSLGRSYAALEQDGVLMPVIDLSVRYQASLRFDDQVDLATTVAVAGPSRVSFTTVVSCGERECAKATVTVATVSPDGRPRRLPEDLKALLEQAQA